MVSLCSFSYGLVLNGGLGRINMAQWPAPQSKGWRQLEGNTPLSLVLLRYARNVGGYLLSITVL